ncbi:MAG: hypothetical protein LKF42_06495 [Streptococcaceae bacterium]|jgi:hypothetical protein|nr:hypothetical protein [Streptococcaceae bacterium]MCH4177196.1 hypothetical protein [Streptococcaceae bacterium]
MSLADKNKKIEEKVVGTYKKIEDSTVGTYKKVEKGAVEGFEKVTDHFVEKLFKKDGESLDEAKKRLKQNEEEQGGRN